MVINLGRPHHNKLVLKTKPGKYLIIHLIYIILRAILLEECLLLPSSPPFGMSIIVLMISKDFRGKEVHQVTWIFMMIMKARRGIIGSIFQEGEIGNAVMIGVQGDPVSRSKMVLERSR